MLTRTEETTYCIYTVIHRNPWLSIIIQCKYIHIYTPTYILYSLIHREHSYTVYIYIYTV